MFYKKIARASNYLAPIFFLFRFFAVLAILGSN